MKFSGCTTHSEKIRWDYASLTILIEEYRKRRCLWMQSDDKFKCRNSKDDAWLEISRLLGADVLETKRKMRNLMSQFYREQRRAGGEVFVSKWFAYNKLLFLQERKQRLCLQ
ncbi:hypothetical protein JTB14_017885 [Gonioctena quinquepunctata]|nr:hypothetical protein JTB14_017885 [Gonioctena quinquepunctata]